jgi:hypothetical protein
MPHRRGPDHGNATSSWFGGAERRCCRDGRGSWVPHWSGGRRLARRAVVLRRAALAVLVGGSELAERIRSHAELFPQLSQALNRPAPALEDNARRFGLDRILDGLAVLIAERS